MSNDVETLLQEMDDGADLNAPDSHGLTPIEHAISHCSIDGFRLLLGHPALTLSRDIAVLGFVSGSAFIFRRLM
jgi:ankyrin repeat protein